MMSSLASFRRSMSNIPRWKTMAGPVLPNTPPNDPYMQDPVPPHRFVQQPPPLKNSGDKAFMADQMRRFDLGKRHLANMMGFEMSAMTERDIEYSIRYLFPCGLTEKSARPSMADPRSVFPPVKQLDIDEMGRPKNPFFYTEQKSFSMICFEIASIYHQLEQESPENISSFGTARVESFRWISNKELNNLLTETIHVGAYRYFLRMLDRISSHPLAAEYSDTLDKYKVMYDNVDIHSRESTEAKFVEKSKATGKRFTARALVTLTPKPDRMGTITVNDTLFSNFFFNIRDREQVIFPLIVTDSMGRFDVSVTVESGGRVGQAGAVRLAVAKALVPHLDEATVERLRLCGLLTYDRRKRERKKVSQHGARRKKSFRKR